MSEEKRRPGGQCVYREDQADYILEEMAKGASLNSICIRSHDDDLSAIRQRSSCQWAELPSEDICPLPPPSTVRGWYYDDRVPEFTARYARAIQLQHQALIDEVVDIADDGSADWVQGERGGLVPDHEHIQRSRLRTDTRKWVASKILRQYADRVVQEHTGPGGGPVQTTELTLEEARAEAERRGLPTRVFEE